MANIRLFVWMPSYKSCTLSEKKQLGHRCSQDTGMIPIEETRKGLEENQYLPVPRLYTSDPHDCEKAYFYLRDEAVVSCYGSLCRLTEPLYKVLLKVCDLQPQIL